MSKLVSFALGLVRRQAFFEKKSDRFEKIDIISEQKFENI